MSVNYGGDRPSHLGDDVEEAPNRFRTHWLISGKNLDRITGCTLTRYGDGDGGVVYDESDGLFLEQGVNGMERRLALPAILVAGMYTLTLSSISGDVHAKVYVLQGEKGDKGEQGPKGEQGEQGQKGDTGDTGA